MGYLVATDLDGTLLRPDNTVSARTRAALAAAREADIEVIYATGRPPRWMPAVYDTTDHRPLTICSNGALTLERDEPIHIDAIPDAVVEEVRQALRGLHEDFLFTSEVWRGHTVKFLAALPHVSLTHADEVLRQVQDLAGHLVEPTHSAYNGLLIEMGPSGVTKAHALQRMIEQRWPDRTVIAIGDMPNDEAMLRSVDIPMTVESGHPWLRDVTQRVLPGPAEDGVAQLLERLVAGEHVT